MKQEWGALAGGAYRTKRGIDQGILASLAIAMLTLVIGAIVRSGVTEALAAAWRDPAHGVRSGGNGTGLDPGSYIGISQDGATPYVGAFGVRRHGHRRTYGH